MNRSNPNRVVTAGLYQTGAADGQFENSRSGRSHRNDPVGRRNYRRTGGSRRDGVPQTIRNEGSLIRVPILGEGRRETHRNFARTGRDRGGLLRLNLNNTARINKSEQNVRRYRLCGFIYDGAVNGSSVRTQLYADSAFIDDQRRLGRARPNKDSD